MEGEAFICVTGILMFLDGRHIRSGQLLGYFFCCPFFAKKRKRGNCTRGIAQVDRDAFNSWHGSECNQRFCQLESFPRCACDLYLLLPTSCLYLDVFNDRSSFHTRIVDTTEECLLSRNYFDAQLIGFWRTMQASSERFEERKYAKGENSAKHGFNKQACSAG